MIRRALSIIIAVTLLCCSAAAQAGAKIKISDEASVTIYGWTQIRMSGVMDMDEKDVKGEFLIPRALVLFRGNVTKHVIFGISTCLVGVGKNGDFTPSAHIADAYMILALRDEINIDIGKYLMPFSRHGIESSAWLHGMDWHLALQKSRPDVGITLRGALFNKKLTYRVGIGDGGGPNEWNGAPRIFGRVAYNVFDPEVGFYLMGTYLGKKKVLSFGASFDVEPTGNDKPAEQGKPDDDDPAYAFAFDAMLDLPLGDNGLTATLIYYYYGPGELMPKGQGLWGDFGFRIKKWEPLVAAEWYLPNSGDKGKRLALLGGLNYWLSGHNAHFKLQLGAVTLDGTDKWNLQLSLQGGVFF